MDQKDEDETLLIERAQDGEREAFDELYRRCERKVYGFIRVRANNEDDAQEIAQETWLEVSQKISTYDPTRASFCTFVKFWANYMLLRYYANKGALRKVEVLLSDLQRRFPDMEREEEIGEVIARLSLPTGASDATAQVASSSEESVEDEVIRAEVYEELLCLVFNGSSPPHQLIAFGFCKLLEWKPREIVTQLSDEPLQSLERKLEADYVNKQHLSAERVLHCFLQLREHLESGRSLKDVVSEPKTLETYEHLLARIVGDTTLREYYTGETGDNHAANIVQWWSAVPRRVWSEIHMKRQNSLGDWFQEAVRRRAARKAQRSRKESGRKDEGEQSDE